jgi:membrane fusion protein (multidrug efflux system)
MQKNGFLILFSLILVAAISCGNKSDNNSSAEKAISVTVSPVEPRDLSLSVVYTGTLEGEKQAKIFASIPEAVVELPVKQGSRVGKGDPVILLDKSGASSRYNQSYAVYQDAADNFKKMKNLFENGAISEQTYKTAKTALEVAEANFESARQQVELTSPIAGIVTDLSVNIGEYVPVGIPLATVARTDMMRLVIYVESGNIKYIKKGQNAEIFVEIASNRNSGFPGIIKEVAESADPETRLFGVEIQIRNPDGILKPGMFARARITTADLKSVLTVPKEAVFSVDGISRVFMVESGRALEKSIVAGESTDEFVIVRSGLAKDDSVIVIGRNLVEDGSLVKVSNIDMGGEKAAPDTTTSSRG